MKRIVSTCILLIVVLSIFNGYSKNDSITGNQDINEEKETNQNKDQDQEKEDISKEEDKAKQLEFDSLKQLSYAESTINGKHISEDFGDPVKIESINMSEDSNENLQGEFSLRKFFEGFTYNEEGVWNSGFFWKWYDITEKNIYGPRNIRIGDSLEEVLKKLPDTMEGDFRIDDTYIGFPESESYEIVSSGVVEINELKYDSGILLRTDQSGTKYISSYLINDYDEYDIFNLVNIEFKDDVVISINLSVYDFLDDSENQ